MELKSKFKLSLVFLAIASPSTSVFADFVNACPLCHFNGFTVGAGLGTSEFMTNTAVETAIGISTLDPNTHLYKFGAAGELFLGYGYTFCNQVYVGGELGVNIYGGNQTSLRKESNTNIFLRNSDPIDPTEFEYTNTLQTQTTLKRNAIEPFLDLKLGTLITPNLLGYLRGGISYNKMTLTSESSYFAKARLFGFEGEFGSGPRFLMSENAAVSSLSSSKTDHVLGARVGGGFEYMVTPNFGLSSNYVYTFYQPIRSSSTGPGKEVTCDIASFCFVEFVDFNNSTKARMADQKVTAEMIYHFNC